VRSNKTVRVQIRAVRRALVVLDQSLQALAPTLAAIGSVNGGAQDINSPLRPRLSAKARASLVLQGRYMGFMRQLRPRQKVQVRKIREKKGVRAAISKARMMAHQ
jgi:hypothetical protein